MPVYFGSGIQLGAGVVVGLGSILNTASVYYDIQDATVGLSNGSSVSYLPNEGALGSSFNATDAGSVPVVATQNSKKVLSFSGSVAGYNISTPLDMSTGSMFFVGQQTNNRMIAFGGQGATLQNCFLGYAANNGSQVLFRGTTDVGLDFTGLTAVSGLKVFGLVKSGSSVTIYDNSVTGVNHSTPYTFEFNAVGYRSGYGNQYSTGYLGDLAYWNTALTAGDAAGVVTALKSIYNIN